MTASARFDELIHPSTRLSIVALLASADWTDFAFVRDRLDLSDSALSKQFATLEDAGYLTIERPVTDRRRRVRVRLTDAGAKAFEGHVAALRAVIAAADGAPAAEDSIARTRTVARRTGE
jgi:DNA-binding MarR family transcriptional regulator